MLEKKLRGEYSFVDLQILYRKIRPNFMRAAIKLALLMRRLWTHFLLFFSIEVVSDKHDFHYNAPFFYSQAKDKLKNSICYFFPYFKHYLAVHCHLRVGTTSSIAWLMDGNFAHEERVHQGLGRSGTARRLPLTRSLSSRDTQTQPWTGLCTQLGHPLPLHMSYH